MAASLQWATKGHNAQQDTHGQMLRHAQRWWRAACVHNHMTREWLKGHTGNKGKEGAGIAVDKGMNGKWCVKAPMKLKNMCLGWNHFRKTNGKDANHINCDFFLRTGCCASRMQILPLNLDPPETAVASETTAADHPGGVRVDVCNFQCPSKCH